MKCVRVVSDISHKLGVSTYAFRVVDGDMVLTYRGKFRNSHKNTSKHEFEAMILALQVAESICPGRHIEAYVDQTPTRYGKYSKEVRETVRQRAAGNYTLKPVSAANGTIKSHYEACHREANAYRRRNYPQCA